jgi:hypothetical protein
MSIDRHPRTVVEEQACRRCPPLEPYAYDSHPPERTAEIEAFLASVGDGK